MALACSLVQRRLALFLGVASALGVAIVVAAWSHRGGVPLVHGLVVWLMWAAIGIPIGADRIGEEMRGRTQGHRLVSRHLEALQRRHWIGTLFGFAALAYAVIVTYDWFGGTAPAPLGAALVAVASMTFLTVVYHACEVETLLRAREDRRQR